MKSFIILEFKNKTFFNMQPRVQSQKSKEINQVAMRLKNLLLCPFIGDRFAVNCTNMRLMHTKPMLASLDSLAVCALSNYCT